MGGNKITVIAPAADGKYYTATGTVKLLVSDDAARTTIKPLELVCSPYVALEKLGIDFKQPGMFITEQLKEVEFTTTSNATIVKVLDVPEGWTVAVTKETHAGTFTVTALNNDSAGEAIVLAADVAVNTVIRTLELWAIKTPEHAASTHTWTFGDSPLIWSDAIQISDCNKENFTNDLNNPQCRSYTSDKLRYYYNWPYVNANAATLCPSPWRVPTSSDFRTLITNLGGNTQNARNAIIAAWGYGGAAQSNSMEDVSTYARYWSSMEYDGLYAGNVIDYQNK